MTGDLEQMCRDHFNEPLIVGMGVGRLIGFAEDEDDCYLIVSLPNPASTVYHSCVGGYHWLGGLRGQNLVISASGERWDDYYRLDSMLEFNGAPKVPEFVLERPWSRRRTKVGL